MSDTFRKLFTAKKKKSKIKINIDLCVRVGIRIQKGIRKQRSVPFSIVAANKILQSMQFEDISYHPHRIYLYEICYIIHKAKIWKIFIHLLRL